MNIEAKSYEIQWIPTAERLPTPTESNEQTPGLNILITVEDEQGNKEVSIGFYNHFYSEFKDLRAWYDMDLDENNGAIKEPFKVTAWAPLPAAYGKGDKS